MAGVKFIFTHATISFVILAMAAGMFAISCFGPLIAVYVRDELQATSLAFGIINAMIGVGMIGGTLLMSRFAQNLSKTHLALWGLLTMGAFVVVLAAFKKHRGGFDQHVRGWRRSGLRIRLGADPDAGGDSNGVDRPRQQQCDVGVIAIAQLIGLVFSGSMAQTLGIRNLFYVSAAMLLLITVFGYFRLPRQPSIGAGTAEQQPGD